MRGNRFKAAAIFALVFALGAITGVAGTRFFIARTVTSLLSAPPDEARRRTILWVLDRRLKLSSEQHDRIDAILAAHRDEFAAIARSVEPQLDPLMHRIEGEVRLTLTPAQQAEFDRLTAEHDRRRKRWMGGPKP